MCASSASTSSRSATRPSPTTGPPRIDGSRPGTYYVNTYEPETRARYEVEALAFHESVPGHHIQIAIAQELTGLPEFRKHAGVTAFIEGWGLYAEGLADELGLYKGGVERLGQLNFDAWRACRLVVDTGIHALGWSRQRAIAFFEDNAILAKDNIVNEVDRYIAWPGQALAYKLGELEIRKLRAQVQARLAARFDMRAFHDRLLGRRRGQPAGAARGDRGVAGYRADYNFGTLEGSRTPRDGVGPAKPSRPRRDLAVVEAVSRASLTSRASLLRPSSAAATAIGPTRSRCVRPTWSPRSEAARSTPRPPRARDRSGGKNGSSTAFRQYVGIATRVRKPTALDSRVVGVGAGEAVQRRGERVVELEERPRRPHARCIDVRRLAREAREQVQRLRLEPAHEVERVDAADAAARGSATPPPGRRGPTAWPRRGWRWRRRFRPAT